MNDKKTKPTTNQKKESVAPIIKRVTKGKHGHHGGSWKIAYADFVTAMMAFFLLMWLVASLNKSQKEGISDYFKQPLKVSLFGGQNVGNQEINAKGGGQDIKQTTGEVSTTNAATGHSATEQHKEIKESNLDEIKKLEELKSKISLSITTDPSLAGLKNQLLMKVVSTGLRIQLIDNQQKPMFDVGSEKLNPEMEPIFGQIAKLLNSVDNKITLEGHTDAHPYHNPEELDYTNWELSSQRANAARRALIKEGLSPDKVVRVSGFGSTYLLNTKDPFDPENRRISIIVMKKGAEEKMNMNNDNKIMLNGDANKSIPHSAAKSRIKLPI